MDRPLRHTCKLLSQCSIIIAFIIFCSICSARDAAPLKVYVIPIAGEVGPGLASFLERAIRDSDNVPENIYVLEMDTFGGRVDSALQIVDLLINVPKAKTIAFVKTKAISAGALIALACRELVMRPNTTLGDCAPITYSSEGVQVMGEKFQSPLRAKFRTLARRNGYPPTLAEAMVTAEMEVYRVELAGKVLYLDSQALADLSPAEKESIVSQKTIVAQGELLTMDDEEALQYGFSRISATTIDAMLAEMGIGAYENVRIEQNWSEKLGIIISRFAPLLMLIGMAALYTELKAPGFGVPGIVGILCLGLVFLNQYIVGLADYTELLLISIGIVLLAMEVFVFPGFGLAGIAGLFLIGVGMVLSFQDFVIPDPTFPWQQQLLTRNIIKVLGSFIAAFLSALFALRYIMPRFGSVVEGPYLGTTLATSRAVSPAAAALAVGTTGVALSMLRPAGKGLFNNEMYDVLTDGEFIEKGTALIVREIKGNRIIVAAKGDE
jgi:membrane-bound serine protease (ClpP class)